MCGFRSPLSLHTLWPMKDTQCCGRNSMWPHLCCHTSDSTLCPVLCEQNLSRHSYYYLWLCHSCTAPIWCLSLHHTTMRIDICAFWDSIFFWICQVFYPSWSSMILSQVLP